MKENKFFSKYLIFALALSTFPVTILYVSNFQNTSLVLYIFPLVLVYLITFIFYVFLFLFFKNKNFKYVYVFSSIFSIWVFIYGIINEKLIGYNSNIVNFLGGHRFLLPISLFFFFLFFLIFNRRHKKNIFKYKFLTTYLILLNIFPLINLIYKSFIIINDESTMIEKNASGNNFNVISKSPNVYYIILDGYASTSSMKRLFDFNNSDFNFNLENIGFKIQSNSKSNYCRTNFSLSSTLNLNYVQNLTNKKLFQSDLNTYISDNLVSKIFRKNNYKYYLFDSGFGLKNKYDSDEILIKSNNVFLSNFFSTSDNDLYSVFINNSIFKILNSNLVGNISVKNYSLKVLNVFEKLPLIAKNRNKKFVFAHIISPHPPFLFNEYGIISEYGYDTPNKLWNRKLYFDQLKFINKKIVKMVRQIIINDKNDKIIIIQGDHGSRILTEENKLNRYENWVDERFSIFNGIYVSNNLSYKKALENEWDKTSVNTFRIIFNKIFNSNFQLLSDKLYYSDLQQPYNFLLIK